MSISQLPQIPLPSPAARQWLYRISTVVVPLLLAYGVVDADKVALWLALAGAVLGTGTASVALKQQRRDGTL